MIPEKYRLIVLQMRGVALDPNGEEVLAGLTAEETAEFFHHVENPDLANSEATARYFELHGRYAAARLHGESRPKSLRKSPSALPWEMLSDQPTAQRPDAENSNDEGKPIEFPPVGR